MRRPKRRAARRTDETESSPAAVRARGALRRPAIRPTSAERTGCGRTRPRAGRRFCLSCSYLLVGRIHKPRPIAKDAIHAAIELDVPVLAHLGAIAPPSGVDRPGAGARSDGAFDLAVIVD